MKRIPGKQIVVAALVVAALYTVGSNVLLPLLAANDIIEDDVIDMLDDDMLEQNAVASHALHAIDTNQLFWNVKPARDPYSNRLEKKMMKKRHAKNSDTRTMPVLSGLVAGEQSRLVVLNGHVVGVGQSVAGYRVTDISPDGVQIMRDQVRSRLMFGSGQ